MNTPLTAALKARDDIVEHLKPIDQRIGKLERLIQSSSAASSEKSALHSDHAVRLKDWVANGDTDALPPVLDADRLQRLDAEIGAHESSKASASEGLRALIAARSKLVDELKVAAANVHFHAVETIAVETMPKIAEEVNAALASLAVAKGKLESFFAWIRSEGRTHADGGNGNGLFGLADRLSVQSSALIHHTPTKIDFAEFRDSLHAILLPAKAKEAA